MNRKNLLLTIGTVVLGVGMAVSATAYANHGHRNTTTGDMMGNTAQTHQQTMDKHMGDNTANKNAAVTTAANQYDGMHGTNNTQNHMTADTDRQDQGNNDHHQDTNNHHGNN